MSDTFTKRVAAVNSSLGMETYIPGATLDFPKISSRGNPHFH